MDGVCAAAIRIDLGQSDQPLKIDAGTLLQMFWRCIGHATRLSVLISQLERQFTDRRDQLIVRDSLATAGVPREGVDIGRFRRHRDPAPYGNTRRHVSCTEQIGRAVRGKCDKESFDISVVCFVTLEENDRFESVAQLCWQLEVVLVLQCSLLH